MTRLAVFRGHVSFGGHTYEKGEEAHVRERDVRALLDTGVVRWADEGAPSSWDDDGGAQSKRKKTPKRKRKS